jgi:hypothetical protein
MNRKSRKLALLRFAVLAVGSKVRMRRHRHSFVTGLTRGEEKANKTKGLFKSACDVTGLSCLYLSPED